MKPNQSWIRTSTFLLVSLLALLPLLSCNGGGGKKKKKKPWVISFLQLPADGTMVNETFLVEIEITDRKTGSPVSPNPPLDVTLDIASGNGSLTGTLVLPVTTSTVVFGGLTYDGVGPATIRATSSKSGAASATPVEFAVNVAATPADLDQVLPGAAIPTVDFELTDFNAAPFDFGGNLQWSIVNTTTMQQVQSGSVSFADTSIAQVAPAPVIPEDSYELIGVVQGSTAEARVPFVITTIILQNRPGPFVALRTGCVGAPYSDNVAFAVPGATSWSILSGSLPAGLALDGGTGDITGTPTAASNMELTIRALTSATTATPIRCAVAIFTPAETEILPGQDFTSPGPTPTVFTTDNVIGFTSTFDGNTYNTAIKIHSPDPATITRPLPMFIVHHGRGFHFQEYDDMLSHVASYDFIGVSVEDCTSFYAPNCSSPNGFYDGAGADAGMMSAAAFMKGVMDHMIQRSNTPGDPFEGKIDGEKVFMSGHSRGGGATHGAHQRGLDFQIAGVVYFMAYDLRCFNLVIPPATPPRYDIPAAMPRLPSLIIAAEMDSDLVYPIGDHFIERATGPMTSVTLYGGNHARISDPGHPDDVFFPCYPGPPYISRAQEQALTFAKIVAFLKRWGDLDLSVEGILYGDEEAGSPDIGVTSYRNAATAVLVDDYQDGNSSTNSLGAANSLTGGSRIEAKAYPPDCWGACTSITTVGIRNNIITFNATSANYTTGIPSGTTLSNRRRLIFRTMQTSLTGYDWMTFDVMLEDGTGAMSTVNLLDRYAPSTTYLPDYMLAGNQVYDRFVEVQVDLSSFTGVNLDDLVSVQFLFDFASIPGPGDQIAIDDVRFE